MNKEIEKDVLKSIGECLTFDMFFKEEEDLWMMRILRQSLWGICGHIIPKIMNGSISSPQVELSPMKLHVHTDIRSSCLHF